MVNDGAYVMNQRNTVLNEVTEDYLFFFCFGVVSVWMQWVKCYVWCVVCCLECKCLGMLLFYSSFLKIIPQNWVVLMNMNKRMKNRLWFMAQLLPSLKSLYCGHNFVLGKATFFCYSITSLLLIDKSSGSSVNFNLYGALYNVWKAWCHCFYHITTAVFDFFVNIFITSLWKCLF